MSQHSDLRRAWPIVHKRFPILAGVLLASAIAALSMTFRTVSGLAMLSPMILSIIAGAVIQNLFGTSALVQPGIVFSAKRMLRLGIVLLGLQLTITQMAALGGTAVLIVAATLLASFFAIRLIGRIMGIERPLVDLIAAGTSVCGASAVVAANTVAQGRDEDVAYAIACVSILGTISMFAYPLLAPLFRLDAVGFGLWTGSTVHEVAQVVAASFQFSDEAGQYGTVSKLARVVMLAPLILCMAMFASNRAKGIPRAPAPWFVLGFVFMVLVNSVLELPASVSRNVPLVTTFLMSMALAAIGLQIDVGRLWAKGMRPLLLGIFGWLFIAMFGLLALKLAGY